MRITQSCFDVDRGKCIRVLWSSDSFKDIFHQVIVKSRLPYVDKSCARQESY